MHQAPSSLSSRNDTVLAVDLGGTRFRAALVDDKGDIVQTCVIDSPSCRTTQPGWDEIDPDAWWRGLCTLCDTLAAQAGPAFDAVQALAICGVTRTQVLIDAQGAAIRPAITWRDTRAAPDMAGWLAPMPASHPEYDQINAFHPWARLAWLLHTAPQHAARVHQVLDPKDYLNFRLTGQATSDTVSMARLAAAATAPADGPDLLTALGADPAWVPPLLDPLAIVGPVQTGLPGSLRRLAGRPVVACANDTWAAVAGLGALRPGYAYNISGTTEVFGAVGAEPVQAQGLMTVDWGGGHHQIGGPSQNGADTIAWLLPLLGCLDETGMGSVAQALDTLLAAPRDPQPALFLPYLQGERVPYWDPHLRGAFLGLNRRHGPGDLAWAVLEGVAFLNRIVLERAETALGNPVKEIRFGGGAASNTRWCQIKADICERPVIVGRADQPGVLGTAVAAWTAIGRFAHFAAAQDQLVRVAQRYEPRSQYARTYRTLYARFREAETVLAPVSQALAGTRLQPAQT